MNDLEPKKILSWAQEVIKLEAVEVEKLANRLDDSFVRAIEIMNSCSGKVVASGMGKAGIIANKFSATISSTGTPSLSLHPAEAVHGDLGRVSAEDVVIMLSFSGETDEVKVLLPFLKKIGAKIIAMTGNPKSFLALNSDVSLDVHVDKEACALNLAPTTSTTVMLAMCDALAVALMRLKGFEAKDFAMFHPRGSLGRKLLLKVEDCMRKDQDNALVPADMSVSEVLIKITEARSGAAVVIDEDNHVLGIFTDGDLRRHLEKDHDIVKRKVCDVMTVNPTVVSKDILASEAMRILEEKKIDEVPVIDSNNFVAGMLDVQDLLKAGVV